MKISVFTVVLLVLEYCTNIDHIISLAYDIELDTLEDVVSGWKVGRACLYQNNYTDYESLGCPVLIHRNQDPEFNTGNWSPCQYPSCEITFTNTSPNPEDIPTGVRVRSFMHAREDNPFPPRIVISVRVTPDAIKHNVAVLEPQEDWSEDFVGLLNLSETSIIYVKLEATFVALNYGVIDKIVVISNGRLISTTPPSSTPEEGSTLSSVGSSLASSSSTITEFTETFGSTSDGGSSITAEKSNTTIDTTIIASVTEGSVSSSSNTDTSTVITTKGSVSSSSTTETSMETTTEFYVSSSSITDYTLGTTIDRPVSSSSTTRIETTTEGSVSSSSTTDTSMTSSISESTSSITITTKPTEQFTASTAENTESTSSIGASTSKKFTTNSNYSSVNTKTEQTTTTDVVQPSMSTPGGANEGRESNYQILIFIGPYLLIILILIYSCLICIKLNWKNCKRDREDGKYRTLHEL